jgi:hypothetical protein
MVSQVSTSSHWWIDWDLKTSPNVKRDPKKKERAGRGSSVSSPLKMSLLGEGNGHTGNPPTLNVHGRWMWPATRTSPRRQNHFLCLRPVKTQHLDSFRLGLFRGRRSVSHQLNYDTWKWWIMGSRQRANADSSCSKLSARDCRPDDRTGGPPIKPPGAMDAPFLAWWTPRVRACVLCFFPLHLSLFPLLLFLAGRRVAVFLYWFSVLWDFRASGDFLIAGIGAGVDEKTHFFDMRGRQTETESSRGGKNDVAGWRRFSEGSQTPRS